MKIIFAIPSMSGGGAERVISVLANEFVRKGIETKILMTAGHECAYDLSHEVELFQAGEKTGGNIIKRLSRILHIRQYLRGHRDGIIVAFEPDAAFFCSIAKMGLGIPMISSERNDPKSFGNSVTRKIAYKYSQWIVFQTQEAKDCFSKQIQQKSSVIANPIAGHLPIPYMGERKKTIVCVGRFEKQKNHMLLLGAFSKFVHEHPDYTLSLYGRGSLEEELREATKNLEIADKVIFEGFKKDVISQIRNAGMYVLSSDYEGISNSLLEAMAIGLPVISTDCPCGGSRMCIQDGVNGRLIPVGDEDALVEAMCELASNSEMASRMGETAVAIRTCFSAEKVAEAWIEIIADINN